MSCVQRIIERRSQLLYPSVIITSIGGDFVGISLRNLVPVRFNDEVARLWNNFYIEKFVTFSHFNTNWVCDKQTDERKCYITIAPCIASNEGRCASRRCSLFAHGHSKADKSLLEWTPSSFLPLVALTDNDA